MKPFKTKRVISDEQGVILYVSRGLLSSLTEAKEVLTTIAEENSKLRQRIIINTYAVIDGEFLMFDHSLTWNEQFQRCQVAQI